MIMIPKLKIAKKNEDLKIGLWTFSISKVGPEVKSSQKMVKHCGNFLFLKSGNFPP